MTQCIKCGKAIPDGELFCRQCSLSPVIAELNDPPTAPQSTRPDPARPRPAAQPVRPQPSKAAVPQKPSKKLLTALICVSVCFVLVLTILLVQQGKLQVQKNRLRTGQDELERQLLHMQQTEQELADAAASLEQLQEQLKEKEAQIKSLSAQLAESQSSQNQGEYDMEQLRQDMEQLQEEYDTMKEEWDLMEQAVEAAAKYKEKAQFLDSYVVFVMNNGTKLYHTYDCEDFTHSNFWTYSPKLAQKQGFKPCSKCN